MKIKTIIVNKNQYIYRTLLPEDFLSMSTENDFNIFEVKKSLSMYEKILDNVSKESSNEYNDLFYKNIINNILKICLIEYNKNIFNENYKNVQLFIFNNIIISSLKAFKIPPEINIHSALVIDSICKRYSVLPIDILFEKKEYNKLDAYFFNKEICAISIQNELDNFNKKNKKNV